MRHSFTAPARVRSAAHILLLQVIALVAVWTAADIALCHADEYISPDLVKITTPVYRPSAEEFQPQLGTYSYTVSWQGIPAATLTAKIDQEGMTYRIDALAKTYSGIDLFYKLRYRAQGTISAIDYYPQHTTISQIENSRNRLTEMTFFPNGEIESIRTDLAKNEVKKIKFDPGNFTLDPFSAAFLARGLKWQKGETKEFDTFNGKSRYLIKLTAEDKVQMEINDEMRDVWEIAPQVYNLTNAEQSKKLRKASIYVTADRSRDVVKIVSSVFIGSVTTQLDSFEPSTKPLPGTHIAVKNSGNLIE